MNSILQDLQFALRQLRKSPGFTLTAVLTLALGIGSTAAVYSVIHSVLLQPLPYSDPGSLVGLAFTWPHSDPNAEQTGISAEFVRDHSNAFTSVAIMDDTGPSVNLSVNGGHPIQVSALRVSEGYFRTLGAMPQLGRGFVAEEDRPGGVRSVVLSDGLWKRIFNRDASILGRPIHVNQESFNVVGVMPPDFTVSAESAPGVMATPGLWIPLQLGPKDPGYDGDNYEMVGRLKPGVTLVSLQQQLSALEQPFYQSWPTYKKWTNGAKAAHTFRAWPLQDVVVTGVRRSLLTVMGAVLAVLLVACLNLAGLMTARAMRRTREISLRTALGATAGQLLRLLVCEGLLLAMGGGVLAIVVATVGSRELMAAAPMSIPALNALPSTWFMAVVVLLISLAATSIFSTLPAWALLRRSTREMKVGSQSVGDSVSHARISRALMVLQVALAMVLVSTASNLLGTFLKLRSVPSGVEPNKLTVFQVTLRGDKYAKTEQTSQFVASVLDRMRQSPGIASAAAVQGLPLDRGLNDQGYPTGRSSLQRTIEFRPVTPSYFEAMGIPLLAGRALNESDRAASDPVAVIGETTARKWWPGRSPIGEYIHADNKRDWRIVGVVADVHAHSLVEDQGFLIYGPMVQLSDDLTSAINQWFPTSFVVRTKAHVDIAAIAQEAVSGADPEIPIAKLTTMQSVIDDTIQEPRFLSFLATGFSAFAVGLTVIGLFGLLSYQVTQRTREIGVRMALGADRSKILRGFLGRGISVASAGLVLGIGLSWMMRPVVAHLLSDSGIDPANGAAGVIMNGMQAIAVSVAAVVCAALIASWLPARRAASIEPMEALRAD